MRGGKLNVLIFWLLPLPPLLLWVSGVLHVALPLIAALLEHDNSPTDPIQDIFCLNYCC